MKKIAINCQYGGFSVNDRIATLLRHKGVKVTFRGERYSDGSLKDSPFETHYLSNEDFGIKSDNYDAYRADKRLIEAIEEVGEDNAGGMSAKIKIVEIPDDVNWIIDEYDGWESVHETHRVWN